MFLPLLAVFLWIGVVSFGGGLAIVPEMHRQLVELHPWLTSREFADGYAFGQLAPGPNMLSVVFYGYKIGGLWGALGAPVASFGPGAVLSCGIARAWSTLKEHRAVLWIRRGLVPVGAGLMAAGVFVLARETVTSGRSILLLAVTAILVERKLVNNAVAVVLAGAAGYVFTL